MVAIDLELDRMHPVPAREPIAIGTRRINARIQRAESAHRLQEMLESFAGWQDDGNGRLTQYHTEDMLWKVAESLKRRSNTVGVLKTGVKLEMDCEVWVFKQVIQALLC